MPVIDNRLDQKLDIAGSLNQSENLIKSEEPGELGSRIPGQLGFNASITVGSSVTISGLVGMSNQSVGRFITLFGANNSNNNGTFLISLCNSSTSVDVLNLSGSSDLNNGSISWIERNSYSLEDDLNYVRTDRSDIKGVNYFDPIPTYVRPNATTTLIPANLSNIAGKTTDAKALVNTRKYQGAVAVNGQNFIHVNGAGLFPYANSINRLGLPVHDLYDAGNDNACYCDIIDINTGVGLNTINDGYKIFGFSRKGSSGVDGNSFEVELRSMHADQLFSQSIPYVWEIGQPNVIDIYFPFRELLSSMDESALRIMVVHGVSSGGISVKPTSVGQLLYCVDSSNLIFTPERPLFNDQGIMIVNDDDVIVVA